jgi:hypothetical protein
MTTLVEYPPSSHAPAPKFTQGSPVVVFVGSDSPVWADAGSEYKQLARQLASSSFPIFASDICRRRTGRAVSQDCSRCAGWAAMRELERLFVLSEVLFIVLVFMVDAPLLSPVSVCKVKLVSVGFGCRLAGFGVYRFLGTQEL